MKRFLSSTLSSLLVAGAISAFAVATGFFSLPTLLGTGLLLGALGTSFYANHEQDNWLKTAGMMAKDLAIGLVTARIAPVMKALGFVLGGLTSLLMRIPGVGNLVASGVSWAFMTSISLATRFPILQSVTPWVVKALDALALQGLFDKGYNFFTGDSSSKVTTPLTTAQNASTPGQDQRQAPISIGANNPDDSQNLAQGQIKTP